MQIGIVGDCPADGCFGKRNLLRQLLDLEGIRKPVGPYKLLNHNEW